MIEKQRDKRGVLVYLDDNMLNQIETTEDYKLVTEDTPDEELRAMGKKVNGRYPVLLIGKKYGKRGLDYRAFGNTSGIALIIQTSCDTDREFVQLCKRVGRHDEDCWRIICSTIKEIDHKGFVAITAEISAQLDQIKIDMEEECRQTPVKDQNANDREERLQQQVANQAEANDGGMGLQAQQEDRIEE